MVEDEQKIGEIQLGKSSKVIVKKAKFKDKEYITIRVWVETPKYTGFTKKGITLTMEKFGELMKILEQVK